jgi:DNA replication licensing factor MCM4
MIVNFDGVIKRMFEKHFIAEDLDEHDRIQKQNKMHKLMVAITNLGDIKIMRDIDPESVNKLISFRGIVVRVSDVVPEMRVAIFKCINCEHEQKAEL